MNVSGNVTTIFERLVELETTLAILVRSLSIVVIRWDPVFR